MSVKLLQGLRRLCVTGFMSWLVVVLGLAPPLLLVNGLVVVDLSVVLRPGLLAVDRLSGLAQLAIEAAQTVHMSPTGSRPSSAVAP